MKRRMQKMLTLLSAISILTSTLASANDGSVCVVRTRSVGSGPTCGDVIKACDTTIAEKNKALELKDVALKASQDQSAGLEKENAALKDAKDAWYRNPLILGALGIAAGFAASQVIGAQHSR